MSREILEDLVNEILDEVSLGLCFEMHRSCKRGMFFLDEMDSESQKMYEIVNERGLDVFGQLPSTKKQYDCVCPNCHRNMAASRFAPHLEKCMGMGASIPRIASRRIASHTKKGSEIETDDNSGDNDWTYQTSRKAKKLKKEKKTFKKGKTQLKSSAMVKGLNPTNLTSSQGSPSQETDEMLSLDERKSLLLKSCGVISEHTKKMCTRSLNCPQHTDDQRRAVRNDTSDIQSGQDSNSTHMDSTWSDDIKNKSTSAAWEGVSIPSPVGSSSTITSYGSTKKRKHSKLKRKKKLPSN